VIYGSGNDRAGFGKGVSFSTSEGSQRGLLDLREILDVH